MFTSPPTWKLAVKKVPNLPLSIRKGLWMEMVRGMFTSICGGTTPVVHKNSTCGSISSHKDVTPNMEHLLKSTKKMDVFE